VKLAAMKPRDSRIAAVLLLLIVLVIAYFALLHWWFVAPMLDVNAQMSDLRDTQSRFASAIAEKPQLQQRIASLGQGQATDNAFLPEDDPSAAAAGLMQRVVDVVGAHPEGGSCEVSQKMPVPNPPASDNEPYRKVAVSISLRCDMQPLAAVMHDLEQGTPYLFIDDLTIYRNPVAAQQAGQQASAPPPLEVQFTLSGYVRQSRSGGAAPSAPPSTGDEEGA
jgi:general secretion pathway protein M